VAMSFETLMSEIKSLSQPITNRSEGIDLKPDVKQKIEKRTFKKQLKQQETTKKSILQKQLPSTVKDHESTTTLMPSQSLLPQKAEALLRRKSKRSNLPTK